MSTSYMEKQYLLTTRVGYGKLLALIFPITATFYFKHLYVILTLRHTLK